MLNLIGMYLNIYSLTTTTTHNRNWKIIEDRSFPYRGKNFKN